MLQPGGNTRPKSSSPTYRLAGGGLYRPHLPEKAPYSSGSTITRADASSHGVENPNALGTEAPGELLNSTGQASLVACPTPEAQATVESRAASWPDERGSVAACLTPLAGDYCLLVCKLQDFFNGPRSPQLPTSGTPSSSPALLRRPSKPPLIPTVVCQETSSYLYPPRRASRSPGILSYHTPRLAQGHRGRKELGRGRTRPPLRRHNVKP